MKYNIVTKEVEGSPSEIAEFMKKFNDVSEENVVPVQFPVFSTVKLELMDVLETMSKNVIQKSSNFQFVIDGQMLQIESLADWQGFLQEFVLKSGAICSYFGVPNKFKISMIGRAQILKYEGGLLN